jgi:hypothetical protein
VFLVLAVASRVAGAFPPWIANSGGWASNAAPAETPAIARRRRRNIPVDSVCSMIESLLSEYCRWSFTSLSDFYNTRRIEDTQLDEGIGDTLVSISKSILRRTTEKAG